MHVYNKKRVISMRMLSDRNKSIKIKEKKPKQYVKIM